MSRYTYTWGYKPTDILENSHVTALDRWTSGLSRDPAHQPYNCSQWAYKLALDVLLLKSRQKVIVRDFNTTKMGSCMIRWINGDLIRLNLSLNIKFHIDVGQSSSKTIVVFISILCRQPCLDIYIYIMYVYIHTFNTDNINIL